MINVTLDTSNLVNRVTKIKSKIKESINTVLVLNGAAMAYDIADRNSTTWAPPMRADGRGKYFDRPGMGASDSLFDALNDLPNQMQITTTDGKVSLGLGSEIKLKNLFGYWDLFEGYGIYERPKGVRAGGSTEYGFTNSIKIRNEEGNIEEVLAGGKKGEGVMVKVSGGIQPHPGVLPAYMFRDTANYYKPLIKKDMLTAIINGIK